MTLTAPPLQEINPDYIKPNPDNPRLIFQEDEMNELLESIREVGVKVPISVYPDGNRYVLLDGERRWRCTRKLNLKNIPAIVQPKPTRLENLLMMFNIHNVRVDWDVMPMALKLGEIRDMLEKDGKPTSPKALAAITGVRLATVRRALELLDLPKQYQKMLLKEAQKPRNEQRIKVDLFIEVYKSLHVIEKYIPVVFEKVSKTEYINAMVDKYVSGVVDNVVGYRELSKIARGEKVGIGVKEAAPVILKLVKQRDFSINQAFEETVQAAYEQRDIVTKVHGITERLTQYKERWELTDEVRQALRLLRDEISRLLED
jgi:ParB/RepB/Spo0J family partition protein